jgi:Bacterial TSP3 repeat/Glucodextranase, domain B
MRKIIMEILFKKIVKIKALLVFVLTMATQSAWAINACQDVFPNGLQSYDTKGDIHFHYNAQLLNASSTALKAKKVHVHSHAPLLSCGNTQCTESSPPSKTLTLKSFEKSNSNIDVTVPWTGTATLGNNGQVNYRKVTVNTLGRVDVMSNASAYHIKELSLDYRAVLNLPAGDYWIENLKLNAESRIEVVGTGSVRLYVDKKMSLPWNVKINQATQAPEKFILVSYSDVDFSASTSLHGFVYANKRVDLDYQAKVVGAIAAEKIMLKTEARVVYQPQALTFADFADLCSGDTQPVPDTTPPTLTINSVPAETEADSLVISGTVSDPVQQNSGVASVKVITSGGVNIFATIAGDQYSATVPLVLGTNLITVEARDLSNNLTTRSVTVNRIEINPDSDGDGYPDAQDRFPNDPTEWADLDNDGIGDNKDTDRDGDGFSNDIETQVGTNPNDANSKPSDLDGDGIPDSLDPDRDGDGVNNDQDRFPDDRNESSDLDNDGIGDNADTDRDGDGFSNDLETQVGTDPNDANSKPVDRDGDGIPDSLDPDRDGDGVNNDQDKFPDDATESSDLDNDGIGDNADTDRDGDGFSNEVEAQRGTDPNDANDYPDTVTPLVQIVNPANETVATDFIVLRGTVSDPVQPYSGIASVKITSNRFSSLSVMAVVDGSNFTAEVPLALGVNLLTVTAIDNSANQTQATHTVNRVDLARIFNVTPANGAVIAQTSVTLAGQVQTAYPLEQIRFYVNEWQVTPQPATQNIFSFSAENIPLQLGQNNFILRIETPEGVEQQTWSLTHNPDDAGSIKAPEVSIVTPTNNSQLRENNFLLKGRVRSYAGAVSVTVNGQAATVQSAGGDVYSFEQLLSFAPSQTALAVTITATDALNKQTSINANYSLDNTGPVIQLLGRQVAPAINVIAESSVVVTGIVSDENLASVTLNDQPIRLRPGNTLGTYEFALPLQLQPSAEVQWSLVAYDRSGNQTSVSYVFQSSAQAAIEFLVPGDQAEFLSTSDATEPVSVQVAARVTDVPQGSSVQLLLNGNAIPLTLAGTLASGDVSLPNVSGPVSLVVQVINAGQVLASNTRTVKIVSPADVPLALIGHRPANGEINVEPNQPIELNFNKAIDPQKLKVTVRETLHGNTYVNLDSRGANFLDAQGYQLKKIDRDNEPVPVTLAVLPGNMTAGFYPSRQYGFFADLIATVTYDNQELTRFTFKVRKLPTFIMGGVVDQFGQPLSGISVSIPALNRSTVTNGDGGFAFGFQEEAGNEIPGGTYQLIVNPDLADATYGVNARRINLQEGRKNELGLIRLPELNRNAPFQLVNSNQANTSFMGDDLKIDLSDTRLIFNNGRTAGNVQFQFMPFEQLGAAMTPGIWPQWMFTAQPRGIALEGKVHLDIKMPLRNATYDYAPVGIEYVVLLGFNPERDVIEPIGVGKIDRTNATNYRVKTINKVELKTLDYIGYAWLPPENQALLKDVADGKKTLQQLVSGLQQEN